MLCCKQKTWWCEVIVLHETCQDMHFAEKWSAPPVVDSYGSMIDVIQECCVPSRQDLLYPGYHMISKEKNESTHFVFQI